LLCFNTLALNSIAKINISGQYLNPHDKPYPSIVGVFNPDASLKGLPIKQDINIYSHNPLKYSAFKPIDYKEDNEKN